MSDKFTDATTAMFAHAEDPLKSRWWETAWPILHDPNFGPAISKATSVVKEALWLVELRNIHCVYNCVYYGWSYDPLWIDWWDATRVLRKRLATFLKRHYELQDDDDSARGAIHTYCWEKRQTIFNTLIKKFEDETNLLMLFLGGKVPRNRERAQAVYNWVADEFAY